MMQFILVGVGAAVLSGLAGVVLPRWAPRWGLLDDAREGDGRQSHRGPLPRVGGLAVAVGFFVAVLAAQAGTAALALGLGALLLGLHDDLATTDARGRLLAIVGLAVAATALSPPLTGLTLAGGQVVSLGPLGPILSVLWIVGVVVAFDFLDGLDGLAGGVALLACGCWAVFAWVAGSPSGAVAPVALLGALIGFLLHNRHPARIQLGDNGSNLVGFLVAVTALRAGDGAAAHPLVAAGLVLGVPILDAGGTVLRRLRGTSGLFESERGHLHHRLADGGAGHRGAVHRLWFASIVGAAGAAATLLGGTFAVIGFAAVILTVGLLIWTTRAGPAEPLR